MHFSICDFSLWVAGFIGHLSLVCALIRRCRVQRWPVFTAFVTANLLRSVLLYTLARLGSAQQYSEAYWSLGILDVVLQVAVTYEIASKVFRPLGRWAEDSRENLIYSCLVSCVVAGGMSWLASPTVNTWQQMLVIKGSFFSAALQSELFVVSVALSAASGLPWKSDSARIGHGLGCYSLVDIIIEASHTLFGRNYSGAEDLVLSRVRIIIYLTCLIYWNVAIWQKEIPESKLNRSTWNGLSKLQRTVACDLAKAQTRGTR